MKRPIQFLCAALAVLVALPFSVFASSSISNQVGSSYNANSVGSAFSVGEGGILRGFWVESYANTDYPSSPKATMKSIQQEAEQIVSMAAQYGFNTIFYSVTPEMSAMYQSKYLPTSRFLSGAQGGFRFSDPLKILTEEAVKQKIDVCAVISPFYLGDADTPLDKSNLASQNKSWTVSLEGSLYYNPANDRVQELISNLSGELAARYSLAGIAIDYSGDIPFKKDAAFYKSLEMILDACSSDMARQNYEIQLGVILDGEIAETDAGSGFISQIGQKDSVHFILPKILRSVSGENSYQAILEKWTALTKESQAPLFTVNDASRILSPSNDGIFYGDELEINYQQFVNALCSVNGSVISNWSSLQLNAYPLARDLSTLKSVNWDLLQKISLSLPQGFAVLNPPNGTEVDDDFCYVSGICNPDLELTVNGKPVTEISETGVFGVLLPLKDGTNQFDFVQNRVTRNVSIAKGETYHAQKAAVIDTIEEGSAFPQKDDALIIQDKLTLSCTAPAGGKVSVKFQDVIYELSQTDPNLEEGSPAEFAVELDFSEYDPALITPIPPITYTLVYQGRTTIQTSGGKPTLIGNLQTPAIRVTDPITPVYADENGTQFSHVLQMDTVDYVTDIQDEYFHLRSGGFIQKSAAEVLTEPEEVGSVLKNIKNVIVQTIPKGEYVTFAGGGGSPVQLEYNEEERTLAVTFSNIKGMPQNLNYLKSELFRSISVQSDAEENKTTVLLSLKEDQTLYGYYVAFNEGNAILYCKTKFLLPEGSSASNGSSNLPLSDMNIVIDPGLGGRNNRKLGALGLSGPGEAELNLAVSLALNNRLKAYGATVYLTRRDNTPVSDIDRLMSADYQDADLFLSIHHSQEPLSKDGSLTSGVTVTYNEPFARQFSEALSNSLARRLNRTNNGVVMGNAYISQLSMVPAVQLDLGYISNPYEYSHLCSPLEIYQAAAIITEEILNLAEENSSETLSQAELQELTEPVEEQ